MVVLILGILLAVALPLVANTSYWSLRVAAHQLAAQIRETRCRAVLEGASCYLVYYQFSHRYRLIYPDGSSWVRLPEGVEIDYTNFPLVMDKRPTLYFRHTGAPNQGGHVALKDRRNNRLYVIVTPVTGRVRIDKVPP
jgi:Tfp pilus assembly protein FimT